MLRRALRLSSISVVILAASLSFAQAEFSADIVDLQKPGTPVTAKIYFTKDKLRMESQNAGARSGGAVIMNLATQTSTILMPQQHMYMDVSMEAQAQHQGNTFSFFRTGDAESACADWMKMAYNKGGSCHKVRDENVNGRNTVKYETSSASGEVSSFWLDPKLRFPVKWQKKSSSGELRNIQEGAQPASLFEVPAGFTKMDMPGGGMMQQPR
jgi:Domain of unknown function (DUF4412)